MEEYSLSSPKNARRKSSDSVVLLFSALSPGYPATNQGCTRQLNRYSLRVSISAALRRHLAASVTLSRAIWSGELWTPTLISLSTSEHLAHLLARLLKPARTSTSPSNLMADQAESSTAASAASVAPTLTQRDMEIVVHVLRCLKHDPLEVSCRS